VDKRTETQEVILLEFPQNVISKEITSSKVPICPIFEKNEKTVL